MPDSLQWLPDADTPAWQSLSAAMLKGLPVPNGYVVWPATPETLIRNAYDEMKIREKTHFVAARGATQPVLNVIAPDTLIHTLRRLWAESPDAPILIQRMVHSMWCGKAEWQQNNLRINANEGMLLLDPDTYLVSTSGEVIRKTLEPKQRKMIRHVDGTAKVVAREGERTPMPPEALAGIAELASQAGGSIGWAIDDLEKVWLISVPNSPP